MAVGAITGIMFQFYSYPFDTIKTNIQSGDKTFVELMKSKFWTQKSYRTGLMVACSRNVIGSPIFLTVYENCKRSLMEKY